MNNVASAVEQQIRRFALLNDRHDHDGLASLFTEDGSFARPTDPDAPITGREALRAFFRDRPKRRTRHVMANTIVEVLGAAEATAQSYVVLHTPDKVLVGEFQDRLLLQNGEWLFVSRQGSLAF